MAAFTLIAFCAVLLICIGLDVSILYALGFGLLLFLLYGRKKGFAWRDLFRMVLRGLATVKDILIVFVFIGALTALWRLGGTIPVIVCYVSALIQPSVFLLMTFLLNCGLSALTGTSFGTAATLGVLCAAMGSALGVNPLWTGGAVLSGAFFGDRCSPASTSALLVCAVTKTDIYDNLRRMVRSALAPFLLTCGAYLALGLWPLGERGQAMDLQAVFGSAFQLHPVAVLPAAVMFLLAACRVKVRWAMGASIITAAGVSLFLQGAAPETLLKACLMGYHTTDPALEALLGGGGVLSMAKMAGIVCLSSSYSELFQKTQLLSGVQQRIHSLARKTSAYAATLTTAALASLIACSQTLAILLTSQLCTQENPDQGAFACDLEDSAVVVAPLVPWCIAGSAPLAAIGAPLSSLLFACYLYFIPLWRLAADAAGKRKRKA